MLDVSTPIRVTVRQHYGTQHVYPACDVSRLFVAVQGGKTLTPASIAALKAAGFTLDVVADKVTL